MYEFGEAPAFCLVWVLQIVGSEARLSPTYKTVRYHVMKLIIEGRSRQERGKLVVAGSEWIEPSGFNA